MLSEATRLGRRGLLRLFLPAEEPVEQQERRLAEVAEQVREGLLARWRRAHARSRLPGSCYLAVFRPLSPDPGRSAACACRSGSSRPQVGQLALAFGADELCGPIVEKRALRLGDSAGSRAITRAEAAQLLRGAGLHAWEHVAGGALEEFAP